MNEKSVLVPVSFGDGTNNRHYRNATLFVMEFFHQFANEKILSVVDEPSIDLNQILNRE